MGNEELVCGRWSGRIMVNQRAEWPRFWEGCHYELYRFFNEAPTPTQGGQQQWHRWLGDRPILQSFSKGNKSWKAVGKPVIVLPTGKMSHRGKPVEVSWIC